MFTLQETAGRQDVLDSLVRKERHLLAVEEDLQARQDLRVIQGSLVHLAYLDSKEKAAFLASPELQVMYQ